MHDISPPAPLSYHRKRSPRQEMVLVAQLEPPAKPINHSPSEPRSASERDGEPSERGEVTPHIAIVTVNYNSAAFIADFLRSLRAVDYANARLYVVDCASADGSDRIIEQMWPEAVLIRSPENLGFTGGNNLAIERAL